MTKTLHNPVKINCPICMTEARISAVTLRPIDLELNPGMSNKDDMVLVEFDCMTCSDMLGGSLTLPIATIDDYALPPIDTNIYTSLTEALKKHSKNNDESA